MSWRKKLGNGGFSKMEESGREYQMNTLIVPRGTFSRTFQLSPGFLKNHKSTKPPERRRPA